MRPDELKIDPFGILVGHTWAEVGVILDAINRYGVTRFAEIGVHKGGLCALLCHATEHLARFHYLGMEIDRDIVVSSVRRLFHPMAVETGTRQLWFGDAHTAATVREVAKWLAKDVGPAWIYCDGGDKPTEFNLYAPILRPGDLISAHDYDYGGYERAEIAWPDIEQAVTEYSLRNLGFVAPYRITLWRKDK